MDANIYLTKENFRNALKDYTIAKAEAEAKGTTLRDDPSNEIVMMLYKLITKIISASNWCGYSSDWKAEMEGTALEHCIKAVRKYDSKLAVEKSIARAVKKKTEEVKREITDDEYKFIKENTEENPFAYFTAIVWKAFLLALEKKKKQMNALNSSIIHEAEVHFPTTNVDRESINFHRDALSASHFNYLVENNMLDDALFKKKKRKKRETKAKPQCATPLDLGGE